METISVQSVNESLPTPLYHQITLLIRDWIVSGALPAGALLDGEAALAKRLGVSRITVKRAFNELAAEGLVHRHRGRGTIVTSAPALPVGQGCRAARYRIWHDHPARGPLAPLWITAAASGAEEAAALGVPPGAPLLNIERVMRGPRRRALQFIEVQYRPDRFHYHIRSQRQGRREAAWRGEG